MTSANISNLFVQTNVVPNVSATSENGEITSNDFIELMKKSDEDLLSIAGSSEADSLAPKAPVNVDSYKTVDNIKSVESKQAVKTDKVSDEVKKEVKEFDEKVTKAVAKELDVSEDEVKEAMEVLGLTAVDLTDKSNMAQLISQITGQDSISLVLDDSFMKLNEVVNSLFTELEAGLNLEDTKDNAIMLSDVIKEINATDEAEVTPELEVQPVETEEASEQKPTEKVAEDVEATGSQAEKKVAVAETTVKEIVKTEETDTKETSKADATETPKTVETAEKPQTDANTNQQNTNSGADRTDTIKTSEHVIVAGNENNITFTVETNEVTLPNGQTVDVQRIIDQVVEQARTNVSQEKQSIEMLLNPEGLGKVYMEVTKQGNEVIAKFVTESQAMKDALESQLAMLKESISNGETKVNAIEVSVGAHEFEKNLEEGQQQAEDNQEQQEAPKRTRSINLNNLDELSGLMTEEEQLVAQIMKDNGNTVSLQA